MGFIQKELSVPAFVFFADNAHERFLILGIALPQERRQLLVFLVSLLFSIPFIVFSMAGGFLGDRFSKRSVTVGTKIMEIIVMLIGSASPGYAMKASISARPPRLLLM